MDSPTQLLPRVRTLDHLWWMRGSGVGGAIVLGVGVSGAIALAGLKHHTTLWTVALIVVLVLTLLGAIGAIICGVAAFVTRPVVPVHADNLRTTARLLAASLSAGDPCAYGSTYRPDQAFHAHYGRLADHLSYWDGCLQARLDAEQLLETRIGEAMQDHGIVNADDIGSHDAIFNLPVIRGQMRALLHGRAKRGDISPAGWKWTRNTTAGLTDDGAQGGLQAPGGSDWVFILPAPAETAAAWNARAGEVETTLAGFITATCASATPCAEAVAAVIASEAQIEDFQHDRLPSILGALKLIELREAPRVRRRACESC
jgi:hypothetical protein